MRTNRVITCFNIIDITQVVKKQSPFFGDGISSGGWVALGGKKVSFPCILWGKTSPGELYTSFILKNYKCFLDLFMPTDSALTQCKMHIPFTFFMLTPR